MKLKTSVINDIRHNRALKVRLQAAFGNVSESTLYLRLKRNHPSFTQFDILTILSKELHKDIYDLLERDE